MSPASRPAPSSGSNDGCCCRPIGAAQRYWLCRVGWHRGVVGAPGAVGGGRPHGVARVFAACAHIGCCDDSLSRHATQHWRETGHPIIRSFEPGEDWFWDYQRNDYYEGPELAAPKCHPEDQAVPGPRDRVTGDW